MGIALREFGRHFFFALRYYHWFRWSHRKNSALERRISSPFALALSHSWVKLNCFGFFASPSNCSFVSVNYASSDSPSAGAQRLDASRVFSVVLAAFMVIAFLLPRDGIPQALADGSATAAQSSSVPYVGDSGIVTGEHSAEVLIHPATAEIQATNAPHIATAGTTSTTPEIDGAHI